MSQTAYQPSAENNKQFVRDFVEGSFNRHDMASVDKYYTENLIRHNPQVPQSREGFKQYFGGFFQGFPDSKTTVDHIVAEGDKVFAMLTTNSTNKQTGKRVTMRTADLFRIENRKIVEHWDVVDATGMG
jgi:predicted SnoaL-like aldol condensation-catalyzing enzyme